MTLKTLDIVIPVFNEEKNIIQLFERLESTKKKLFNFCTSYIFVNDGSSDKTLEILSSLSKKNSNLKIISFTRNFGHQNALACGVNFSKADYIVTIDADLQDPPELIIDMLEVCIGKYDVVYAKRKERKGENFFKIFSAKMFYKILNYLCDLQIPTDTGDFRIITRKVATEFNNFKEKHKFIRGLIPWLGFKSTFVLYDRDERFAGKTKYSLKKMIDLAVNAIISFSAKPIQYVTRMGLVFILISISYGIYILFQKLFLNNIMPGFTPIFISIIFFGGFNLFFIGLVGTYISKIYEQTKDRPNYIIDKKINFE